MRIPQLSTSLLNYLCLLKRQTKPYTDIMNSFLASSSPLFDMAPDYENVRIPKTNLVGKLDVAHTLRTLATVAKEEQEKENQNLKKRQLSGKLLIINFFVVCEVCRAFGSSRHV
jgi:hypothetical protein